MQSPSKAAAQHMTAPPQEIPSFLPPPSKLLASRTGACVSTRLGGFLSILLFCGIRTRYGWQQCIAKPSPDELLNTHGHWLTIPQSHGPSTVLHTYAKPLRQCSFPVRNLHDDTTEPIHRQPQHGFSVYARNDANDTCDTFGCATTAGCTWISWLGESICPPFLRQADGRTCASPPKSRCTLSVSGNIATCFRRFLALALLILTVHWARSLI